MELRHIRYFVAVAEERSFTRAADRIGIGQPPLSQQIKDLETELDVRLFRRLPHGAELTAAGEAFLPDARAALAVVERATSAAKRAACGQTGRLRIGYASSAFFHPRVTGALRRFIATYPDVLLELKEHNSADLVDHLRKGALDTAFVRLEPQHWPSLRVHQTIEEALVAVVPRAHSLAGRTQLALSELRDDQLILHPRHRGPALYDTVTDACRAAGFEPVLGPQAQQAPSIINLVAAGLGVSIVPASLAQMKVEAVRYVTIGEPAPSTSLMLISNVDRANHSATLANFCSVAAAPECD